MNQQKMVITDWGGVIEQHSEEAYFSYSVLYHVLKQFGGDDIPKNYHEIINEAFKHIPLCRIVRQLKLCELNVNVLQLRFRFRIHRFLRSKKHC